MDASTSSAIDRGLDEGVATMAAAALEGGCSPELFEDAASGIAEEALFETGEEPGVSTTAAVAAVAVELPEETSAVSEVAPPDEASTVDADDAASPATNNDAAAAAEAEAGLSLLLAPAAAVFEGGGGAAALNAADRASSQTGS